MSDSCMGERIIKRIWREEKENKKEPNNAHTKKKKRNGKHNYEEW